MTNFYTAISAWREMLARIFSDIYGQENASPPWLINPATKRRLKLDVYYAEAGIAVRFVGLTAKGQPRQSDWEVLEEEQRDQTRVELCRQNDVELFLIEPLEDPAKQLDDIIRALTRSGRKVAQSKLSTTEKSRLHSRLTVARDQAEDLRRRLARNPEQMMENLAAALRDRENGGPQIDPEPLPPPPQNPAQRKLLNKLTVGVRVAHAKFGQGVVTALSHQGNGELAGDPEATVTILFDADQARTFLVALVADKLSPA